jgi:4-amino-4-deoxy-L-arabinose transferase-like glycosyltransferase
VLATLSLWLFLWNLGGSSISGASDEVIYVRMIQGILHGDHIFPLYHGNSPSFEKPPLKLWLSSVFPLVLGESNFSFRLMDGVLGIGSVLLTVLVAYRLFGSLIGALCSGFIVLSAPEWLLFHHSFRTVVLDGLLTTLSLGMACAAWSVIDRRSRDEPIHLQIWTLTMLGSLAVLTKSVGGLVPLACAACAICIVEPTWRRCRQLWPLVLPALVLAAYVGVVALVGGYSALRIFIGIEILDRVMSGFEGHNTGDSWFYLRYVFSRGGLAPAYLLLIGVAGSLLAARSNPQFCFLLPWLILPIALYSLSSSRVPWYVSPFVPFAAILSVFGTTWCVERVKRKGSRYVLSIVVLIVAVPPYARALDRAMQQVAQPVRRIEIDTVVEGLKRKYDRFIVVGKAWSGRSQPIRGRFNVEGIYREMLKPNLAVFATPTEIEEKGRYVAFVKEDDVDAMPSGGSIIAKLSPNGMRPHTLVVIAYDIIS